MNDIVGETSKVVNEARDKAIVSIRKYAQPKFISAMVEIAISVIMIIGVQLITCGFNLDALLHWIFWFRTGFLSVAVYLLYRAVINARFEKTENRESVVKVRNEYNEKNKRKTLDMKVWLKAIFNLQTKTETYVDKYNRKINKVENKLMKCYNVRRKMKLEKKLEDLQILVSPEYVATHIEHINIKYYIVYYSDFQDETLYGRGSVYTRGNYNKAFNMASFKKMWMYVLSTAILGVSVFSTEEMTIASVFTSVGSGLFMIVTRIVTALLEADMIYDKTITASLLGRIEVLDEWIRYQDQHPSSTAIESERTKIENALRLELKEEYDRAYEEKLNIEKTKIREECLNIIDQKVEEKEA